MTTIVSVKKNSMFKSMVQKTHPRRNSREGHGADQYEETEIQEEQNYENRSLSNVVEAKVM